MTEEPATTLTTEELTDLRRDLAWASRVNPRSPSRRALRRWFERPEVLDLVERLLEAEQSR